MKRKAKPEVRTFKDGRVVYSGKAYLEFKCGLIVEQKRHCRDCDCLLTLKTCDVHHEGESGYGRGLGGAKRNDMSRYDAQHHNPPLKNWAVALCHGCHVKLTHRLHFGQSTSGSFG